MSVHVVIPARMASTRLPGKPLADIAGIPMVVRVAQQAREADVDDVIVAVDDMQVQHVVEQAGFEAVLTSQAHPSGSDRVMEVAKLKQWQPDDIVINVQGDEPLLPPSIIDQLAHHMRTAPDIDIATLSEPITCREDFLNPNIVKVVSDVHCRAIYFSRAPIPFPRDETLQDSVNDEILIRNDVQRHVGMYGYRVFALQQFVALAESRLERIERLEQLRWLEDGGRISVLQSVEKVPGGIDTPEDLETVRRLIAAQASTE